MNSFQRTNPITFQAIHNQRSNSQSFRNRIFADQPQSLVNMISHHQQHNQKNIYPQKNQIILDQTSQSQHINLIESTQTNLIQKKKDNVIFVQDYPKIQIPQFVPISQVVKLARPLQSNYPIRNSNKVVSNTENHIFQSSSPQFVIVQQQPVRRQSHCIQKSQVFKQSTIHQIQEQFQVNNTEPQFFKRIQISPKKNQLSPRKIQISPNKIQVTKGIQNIQRIESPLKIKSTSNSKIINQVQQDLDSRIQRLDQQLKETIQKSQQMTNMFTSKFQNQNYQNEQSLNFQQNTNQKLPQQIQIKQKNLQAYNSSNFQTSIQETPNLIEKIRKQNEEFNQKYAYLLKKEPKIFDNAQIQDQQIEFKFENLDSNNQIKQEYEDLPAFYQENNKEHNDQALQE